MNNENGFTLLEALFAMAIFAVAMLGVIGMQINAIQSDEETRRKDMAVQLLNEGVELVECWDFADTDEMFHVSKRLGASGFGDFVHKVEDKIIYDSWMDWGEGKVSLYLRHQTPAGVDNVRNVYLVAAWDSVKASQRNSLARMIVKPVNMIQ